MIRRARHYLETDESSLGTAMRDREERRPAAPYCTSFLQDNVSEIMAARSAIYFRYDAFRPALLRHCRLAYLSIRFAFRFVFHHPSLIAWAFAHVSFFFSRVFVSPRKVKRVQKCAALKVAAIYWLHPSDRQHTTSGDKIRAGIPEIVWSDWKLKWIFPGISGASCIRNNINGHDEAPVCSSRNHSFSTLPVNLFSRESDLMVGIIEYKNTLRILSENRNSQFNFNEFVTYIFYIMFLYARSVIWNFRQLHLKEF